MLIVNKHWAILQTSIKRTPLQGPECVRLIEVLLYLKSSDCNGRRKLEGFVGENQSPGFPYRSL